MGRRVLIIQGHPDGAPERFCRALAAAYAEGAAAGGHEVRHADVARLDLPCLRTREAWSEAAASEAVRGAQADIVWAQHLLIVYPLWLGSMPALLKAYFEQVMRPGFAVGEGDSATAWRTLLGGRSARIVVTMGMPALAYRWYFRAHSLKSLERNILRFVGIAPLRETLIGSVEACAPARRTRWLERLRSLGRNAR